MTESTEMELLKMEWIQRKVARVRIAAKAGNNEGLFAAASRRPPVFWRAVVRALVRPIFRQIARGLRSRNKRLAVRETAALGDRRFVSVIQFERQRFLIGSSPAAITLLAQLPDEFSDGGSSRVQSITGDKN